MRLLQLTQGKSACCYGEKNRGLPSLGAGCLLASPTSMLSLCLEYSVICSSYPQWESEVGGSYRQRNNIWIAKDISVLLWCVGTALGRSHLGPVSERVRAQMEEQRIHLPEHKVRLEIQLDLYITRSTPLAQTWERKWRERLESL